MARSLGSEALLTTVKAFFKSAGYATPRDAIFVDAVYIEKFWIFPRVNFPKTVREVVALSQTFNQAKGYSDAEYHA